MDDLIAKMRQEVEETSASHRDEVTDLTNTIVAMRAAMERLQADRQQSVQQAVADASQEIAQLKAAVVAMREQMEQMHFEKQRCSRPLPKRTMKLSSSRPRSSEYTR